jgi:hypothetical protein
MWIPPPPLFFVPWDNSDIPDISKFQTILYTIWTVSGLSITSVLTRHVHKNTLSHVSLLREGFEHRRSADRRRVTQFRHRLQPYRNNISAHPMTQMAGGVPTAEGWTRRTNDKRKAMHASKKWRTHRKHSKWIELNWDKFCVFWWRFVDFKALNQKLTFPFCNQSISQSINQSINQIRLKSRK